ncbi:uncharacterized protein PGTG_18371 [Puccinia graminis f. sp. tritici CRL 75-36-700-3]|uniref:Uncharacterized protein n=1 Tax=Puccinia graminis f. sp. tritici (strain CRL 75-36-700-3 / race SCCL) TaxID=418459 RepID=E3L761_PUCGT|nr:uncharacterized protein PGTG_18371 [Puccinia graminis f. sp. tritici CRL 75-36-700-3]EFP92384.2 hypothetical protein PGTG_18371 [Puccinia graminis f. sp. tritici CRL 75-36-700-3]
MAGCGTPPRKVVVALSSRVPSCAELSIPDRPPDKMTSTLSLANLQGAANNQAGNSNNTNPIIDRRRFVGPETSAPFPDFPTSSSTSTHSTTNTGRADGRIHSDSRPICIKVGVISQANGSCYIDIWKLESHLCCVWSQASIILVELFISVASCDQFEIRAILYGRRSHGTYCFGGCRNNGISIDPASTDAFTPTDERLVHRRGPHHRTRMGQPS